MRNLVRLSAVRRIPVLGNCLGWLSNVVVPRHSKVWLQVRQGPAQGIWLKVNPRTGLHYLQGDIEPEVQRALVANLRPGQVFYDIGSNLGFFALLAARLVGPQGRVVAFEAEPEVAARLREHVSRNDFSNISVEEVAVWSEAGSVAFARSDPQCTPDRGLGHVEASAGSDDSIQVPAVTLDDYARQRAPDFLKCDVEGAEVRVFQGALRLLSEKRPGIVCELHSQENRQFLTDEFIRKGYVCHPCGEHHLLAVPSTKV